MIDDARVGWGKDTCSLVKITAMINFYAKEIVWFIFWWYLPPQRYGQFNLFFY
jgi:hypothetical protein